MYDTVFNVLLSHVWMTGTWIALEETDTKYEMKEISLYGSGGKLFTAFATRVCHRVLRHFDRLHGAT